MDWGLDDITRSRILNKLLLGRTFIKVRFQIVYNTDAYCSMPTVIAGFFFVFFPQSLTVTSIEFFLYILTPYCFFHPKIQQFVSVYTAGICTEAFLPYKMYMEDAGGFHVGFGVFFCLFCLVWGFLCQLSISIHVQWSLTIPKSSYLCFSLPDLD